MTRTSLTSRVSKLEVAARFTGRVHTIDVRSYDGKRAAIEAEVKRREAALIASGEAGPDDLFVAFVTIYEPEPDWRPAQRAATWAAPATETDEPTQAERFAQLAERGTALAARTAPPAAESPRDLSGRSETAKARHAADMAAFRVHPPIGRA